MTQNVDCSYELGTYFNNYVSTKNLSLEVCELAKYFLTKYLKRDFLLKIRYYRYTFLILVLPKDSIEINSVYLSLT